MSTSRPSPVQVLGNLYATVMVVLSIFPIFWMLQFFWLVPQLREYFLVTLLVPAMGLGIGIYGLVVTRGQRYPADAPEPDAASPPEGNTGTAGGPR